MPQPLFKLKILFLFLLLWCCSHTALAQTCTTPGQNPSTAFPVCGTTTFNQTTVPICGGRSLTVPGCSGNSGGYADKNPFWYRFTCYQAGTLGFVITPNSSNSDYDWQLYDITGRNPDDIYTDASLIVTGNWAGTYGNTGASNSGVDFIQCGSIPSDNKNTFSKMPQLQAGHTYLLLISHYSDNQSGYSLSFGGGTAVITDPVLPKIKSVEANCGGDIIRISLTRKILCKSIAADGSDFSIDVPGISIVRSSGFNCTALFDTDSIELRLSGFLDPGTYQLRLKKGSDNNTLLDYCERPMTEGEAINITILPKAPTPMDSLATVSCAPGQLKLVFKRAMLCSSIAGNGTDFLVNGTYPVSVSSATGNCNNGLTKEVIVTLSSPLQTSGNFNIVLKKGSDGNTLIDECGVETLPAQLPFSVMDTVNADFTYNIDYGCQTDTVYYWHHGKNAINEWKWTLDEGQSSTAKDPVGYYKIFDVKNVQLIVSNGFCKDTSAQKIELENFLKADFQVMEDNCPKEPVIFTSLAKGKNITHSWSFGDGNTAVVEHPKHIYTPPISETHFPVRYTITDEWGCQQTAQKNIFIYSSCTVFLPNAFTPNGDGINDVFRPLNAVKADGLEFLVYNRWGQLLFKTDNWKQGWNGKLKGQLQPSGVYVWMIRYINRDTQQKMEQKGTVTLIR
jgi:gliding motility-associated-like protein